jgi:phenylacetate-CoA ligase
MRLENIKTTWFLFLYSVAKPNTRSYFRELLRNQFLPRDELERLNWSRTRALLRHAYDTVPYYRKRFISAGVHPGDIVRPEDYASVPVLTRDDLRRNFQEIISREAGRRDLLLSTTGGSTGEPVKTFHDKRVGRAPLGWRMLTWWQLSPDASLASVYRLQAATRRARFLQRLLFWPTRRVLLDATSLTSETMKDFVCKFNKVRPKLLHGYVGALEHLAFFVQENSLAIIPPKAIWTTSSPVTKVQEQRIQAAFGAPVYDQYGSCEVHWLAAQCPAKSGLHMFHDVRRIEFLDAHNQPCPVGEIGNIAVTDLQNRAFPLIRYLNGDRGRALPTACPCGITLPLMDKVYGRTTDTFRLPSGKCIVGEHMTTLFDATPDAVLQFQVQQLADYSIRLLVVPNPDYAGLDAVLAAVAKQLERETNTEVPVAIQKVDAIPHVGGKLRFVKSDVPQLTSHGQTTAPASVG